MFPEPSLSQEHSTPIQVSDAFRGVTTPVTHARRARCQAHVVSIFKKCCHCHCHYHPFSTCFQRMENERCVHFVSSCELLVARYLFGACFALLYSFCFGAVAGLVTKCCECREGSSGMNSCVLVLNLSLTPSGFSCEQFFCIPFCCVPSFLSVFLGTLCVSLPHTFVARLSCATLFHARSLHFLKMQGVSFKARKYLHLMVGEQHSPIRVVLVPGLLCVIWSGYFAAVCGALSEEWSTRPR